MEKTTVTLTLEQYNELLASKNQLETILMFFRKQSSWQFEETMQALGYLSKGKEEDLLKKLSEDFGNMDFATPPTETIDDVKYVESEDCKKC